MAQVLSIYIYIYIYIHIDKSGYFKSVSGTSALYIC